MSTLQTRTQLILPDDGGPGGDDTVNVTTQISDMIDYLSNAVGIFDYTGSQPATGNFVGRLIRNTATRAIYRYTGSGFEILHDTMPQVYPVTWTSQGGGVQPNVGAGSLVGKFFRLSPYLVRITVDLATGAGVVNGTGDYQFSVPSNALLERTLTTNETGFEKSYLYLPTAGWGAWTPSSGKLQGSGLFPMAVSASGDSRMAGWKNASVGSGAGTGTPTIPAAFTMPSAGGAIYQCSVLADMT